MKVIKLYLLVETKFELNSTLATVLFSAMTLSPVKTFSFCHGHLRFRRLNPENLLDFEKIAAWVCVKSSAG